MTASPFTITPTPPTTLKLEPGQDGKFSFTVNSLAAPDNVHDVILQALLVEGEAGKGKEVTWLVVGPQRTLSISGGKTETVTITVRPTASSPRGQHTIKLAIADKDHPNDAYAYSPSVTCEVSGAPVQPAPSGMPKWLLPVIVAGGAVLVAVIVVLVVKLAGGSKPPPNPPPTADAAVRDANSPADAGVSNAQVDASPTSNCGPRPATVDFERFPTSAAACSNCPVTGEFSCWGVIFSFESIVSNGTRRPNWCQLQGPTTNNPTHTSTHIVTNGSLTAVPPGFPDPPNPSAGYDSGTIIMTFGSAPTRVVFTAVVNNSIALTTTNVTASGVGGAPSVTVTRGTPYTPSGSSVLYQYRRDTITVSDASGSIASIRLNAQGFTALIDDMAISP